MERRRWTDEEGRWLIQHATDGCALIAVALGREEADVMGEAERRGVRLDVGPDALELCPRCSARYVRPGTSSGKAGVCPVCWERMKADAMEERAAALWERRRYEAAKKRAWRAEVGSARPR